MPDPARRLLSARTLRCFRDLLHKRTDTFLGKRQHESRRLPMPSAAEIAFVTMDGFSDLDQRRLLRPLRSDRS